MTNYLDNKINEVFENIVNPSLNKIVKEYDGVNGYKASIVSNCPIIGSNIIVGISVSN